MTNPFFGRITQTLVPDPIKVYKPLPQDDPTQRQPVISLAKKELNWEPTISLEEGLKSTIEYFDKVLRG